ncbi:MAG: efflux RND transporter periplasmic adaptor subunit [Pseudomonadales bacterium]
MSRYYPIFIILFGFGLAGVLIVTGPEVEPRSPVILPPLVRAMDVELSTIQLRTKTHGTVVPRTETELTPEVSGRVLEVSEVMVSGGFFTQGQELLRIDPLDYDVALEEARARLARAQSELSNAKKAHARQIELAEKQSTSASQKDDALNRLRIAQATLREAGAKLLRAKRDIIRTRVVAPYDGRVRSEKVDVGQFVNRGVSIATIYATDFAEVRLPIQDEELAYLDLPLGFSRNDDIGVPLKVILRAKFAGKIHEWFGTVVRTEGELDPQTRMVNVIASVPDPYAQTGLKPPLSIGLFVDAEIIGLSLDNIVVLPRSAVYSESQVYVVDGDNRLRIRKVEILRIVEDDVFISGGLNSGDRVCISVLEIAVEGMKIRLDNATQRSETKVAGS